MSVGRWYVVYCMVYPWDVWLHTGVSATMSAYVALNREFMSWINIFWCMSRSQPAQWLILVLFFPFDWNLFGGEGNLQHQTVNFFKRGTPPRFQGLTKCVTTVYCSSRKIYRTPNNSVFPGCVPTRHLCPVLRAGMMHWISPRGHMISRPCSNSVPPSQSWGGSGQRIRFTSAEDVGKIPFLKWTFYRTT